jgi:hypothetical protein
VCSACGTQIFEIHIGSRRTSLSPVKSRCLFAFVALDGKAARGSGMETALASTK